MSGIVNLNSLSRHLGDWRASGAEDVALASAAAAIFACASASGEARVPIRSGFAGVGSGIEALSAAATAQDIDVVNTATSDEALALLDTVLATDDVVLLKGSNGSGVWKIADALVGEDE